MNEDEMYLFSELQKEELDPSSINGTLAITGGIVGNTIFGDKAMKGIYRRPISESESKIADNLINKAKERGVKIIDDKVPGHSGPFYSSKRTVYRNGSKDAGSLAHELGHAHYHNDKRAGNIGKVAHKIYMKSGGGTSGTVLPFVGGIVAGKKSGKEKARREERGEKEGKIMKHAGWATPLAISSPMLVSEALASKKGLKLLKESGASKEIMKTSRKNLRNAFGTYATLAATNSGIGELSKGIAYRKEKKKLKRDK